MDSAGANASLPAPPVDNANGINAVDESHEAGNLDMNSSREGNDGTGSSTSTFTPTAFTPEEASQAYQSGELKSDFNISSNHSSIRVAFRYEKNEIDGNDNITDKINHDLKLYLCWVDQDGTPCRFYTMCPVRRQAPSMQAAEKLECDEVYLVNEKYHVETTFPGHAFVFCRRVGYEYYDKVVNERKGRSNDTRKTENTRDDINEEGSIVVNASNGSTFFLRKKRKRKDVDGDEDEEQKSEGSEERKEDSWEAYLLVGGYRPSSIWPVAPNEQSDEKSVSERDNETDIENATINGNDDDESDDGEDQSIQLVTIKYIRNTTKQRALPKDPTRMTLTQVKKPPLKNESETDGGNDDPPPKLFDCSTCVQSIPCLRGFINPMLYHKAAFIATPKKNIDQVMGSSSSSLSERLEVSMCITQLDPAPVNTSTKHYDEVILGGWPCRIEPGCFPIDTSPDNNTDKFKDDPQENSNDRGKSSSSLRERFEADVMAACQSIPPAACAKLQKSTPIWINKSQIYGPKAAPIRGRDACFHPGSKWLVRSGMNPAKCGGVEFYDANHYLLDCDLWGPGGLILHELSHAWHCLHTEDGYDNEEIKNCYTKAMDDGLYNCVPVHGPQGPKCKAYACQNQMEYFAELSVAFLGGLDKEKEHNKWYPFNCSQLKEHDPRAFAMLCRIWNVDEENLEKN